MKKVTGTIIMVVMMMVCITMVVLTNANANLETVVDDTRDRFVYGESGSDVYAWMHEWVRDAGDGRSSRELVDGYFRGYGVIDGKFFEETYELSPTPENIHEVLTSNLELTACTVTVAGYYDDWTVYKMYAKSEKEPIGFDYEHESGEYKNYFEGDMYYMVVFED